MAYGKSIPSLTFPVRHFAAIGAVAVILSLGFEPFIQNLVGYLSKTDVDLTQQALVSNASEYNTVGHLQGASCK